MKRFLILGLAVAMLTGFVALPDEEPKKTEETAKAYMGIYTASVSEKLADKYDIEEGVGQYVLGVNPKSPAKEAGLMRGDIITHLDEKTVNEFAELEAILDTKKPGDTLNVKILRKGAVQDLKIKLGKRKSRKITYWKHRHSSGDQYDHLKKLNKYMYVNPVTETEIQRYFLGIDYQEMTKALGKYFGVENGRGVLITDVIADSAAEKAGLKAGDVIVKIDERIVEDSMDLHKALRADKENIKESLKVDIYRDKKIQSFTVKAGEENLKNSRMLDIRKYRIPGHGGNGVMMLKDMDLDLDLEDFHFDIEIPEFLLEGEFFSDDPGMHFFHGGDDIFISGEDISLIKLDEEGVEVKYIVKDDDLTIYYNDKEFKSEKEFKKFLKEKKEKKLKLKKEDSTKS